MEEFSINGYVYCTERDVEDDVIKIFHYCFKNGIEIKMPNAFYQHSPYSYITREEFANYLQSVEVFVQG
jgi:hypothetical protein